MRDALATLWDTLTRPRVSGATREVIYARLVTLLASGVQLVAALDKLRYIYSDFGRKDSRAPAIMLSEVGLLVGEGKALGEAFGTWVTPEERALIEAGERSGRLREAFVDAMYLVKARVNMTTTLVGGSVYPLILAASLVFTLYLVAVKVVEPFSRVSSPETWEGMLWVMHLISYATIHFGAYVLLSLVTVLVTVFASLPYLTGNLRYHLDKVPIYASYRRMQGGLMMLAISIMLSAGVRLVDALELLKTTANPYLRERIEATLYGIAKGCSFAEALDDAAFDFPDRATIAQLSLLDRLDGFDQALRQFASDDLALIQKRVQQSTTVLYYAMLALTLILTGIVTAGTSQLQNVIGIGQ